MAPKKKYTGKIPFDGDGNFMAYARDQSRPPSIRRINGTAVGVGEWRDNYEFDATLIIDGIRRGQSAARFLLMDSDTGVRYEMFMTDALDMLQRAEMIAYGHIEGHWTFCKRGMNYGITLV
jgi:hypothetical protein